eukprot:CAMPEP_0181319698 /NCGR_PEP_ID=MMETSP1101-20121128/17718_1 /TAXON_ID=46948 /ORGANISM="Rhodomonas abbreviata, Strain Caron Lab Isolate" /LENGTH=313 /DNA_ID=CAMNT_0023427331 /DNA_START=167 /DNA_END=1108 /DNA_ORIENTATION=-
MAFGVNPGPNCFVPKVTIRNFCPQTSTTVPSFGKANTACSLGRTKILDGGWFEALIAARRNEGVESIQEEPPLKTKKRSAGDLIVDILCDAGDLALDAAEYSAPLMAKGAKEAAQRSQSALNLFSAELSRTFSITKPSKSSTPSETGAMPAETATSLSWEEALITRPSQSSKSPAGSPWKIVAPGCDQLPPTAVYTGRIGSAGQSREIERMQQLRQALEKHGTISLVENGSVHLGQRQLETKAEARRGSSPEAEAGTASVKDWNAQEESTRSAEPLGAGEVLSRIRYSLLPQGRMLPLRGLMTAVSAKRGGKD